MATIHKNWHTIANDITLSTIGPSKLLPDCTKSSSIHNHLVHSEQAYGSSRQDSSILHIITPFSIHGNYT